MTAASPYRSANCKAGVQVWAQKSITDEGKGDESRQIRWRDGLNVLACDEATC